MIDTKPPEGSSMPPAKKTATAARSTVASRAKKPARAASTSRPGRAATRREVERATARFEKALKEAVEALQSLQGHLGKGASTTYKDLTAALNTLRRNAEKTNKAVLKDFDKLVAALTAPAKSARPAAKRSAAKRTAAKRTTSAASTRSASTRAAKAPARKKPAA
jgi:hypothetical protein